MSTFSVQASTGRDLWGRLWWDPHVQENEAWHTPHCTGHMGHVCVCTSVSSVSALETGAGPVPSRNALQLMRNTSAAFFGVFFCGGGGGVDLGKSFGSDWNQQTHTKEVLGRHCDTARAGSSPNVCSRILPGSWVRPTSAVWAAECCVSAARADTTSQILDLLMFIFFNGATTGLDVGDMKAPCHKWRAKKNTKEKRKKRGQRKKMDKKPLVMSQTATFFRNYVLERMHSFFTNLYLLQLSQTINVYMDRGRLQYSNWIQIQAFIGIITHRNG